MFVSAKKQLSTPGAGAAAVSGAGDGADVAQEASARSKAMVTAVAVVGIILLVWSNLVLQALGEIEGLILACEETGKKMKLNRGEGTNFLTFGGWN